MTPAQQALLRDAMRQLGLTRDAFATRLGVTRRALDSWLLPEDSKEHRGMPSVVEHFVRHILAHAHLSPGVSPAVVAPESRHLLSVDQLDRGRVEQRLADRDPLHRHELGREHEHQRPVRRPRRRARRRR